MSNCGNESIKDIETASRYILRFRDNFKECFSRLRYLETRAGVTYNKHRYSRTNYNRRPQFERNCNNDITINMREPTTTSTPLEYNNTSTPLEYNRSTPLEYNRSNVMGQANDINLISNNMFNDIMSNELHFLNSDTDVIFPPDNISREMPVNDTNTDEIHSISTTLTESLIVNADVPTVKKVSKRNKKTKPE